MTWFDRDFDYINEFIETWNRRVKKLKTLFIVIAAVLVVIGVLCIFCPMETFAAMQFLVAAVLVVHGIGSLVGYASSTAYFKDPMQIVMGILNILLGVLLLFSPVELTVTAFTVMFAFLLIFTGAEKLSAAARLRYYRLMDPGAMIFSGVLSILLAVVFLALPMLSLLFFNYILAAYLIVSGVSLLAEALSMKKIRR